MLSRPRSWSCDHHHGRLRLGVRGINIWPLVANCLWEEFFWCIFKSDNVAAGRLTQSKRIPFSLVD